MMNNSSIPRRDPRQQRILRNRLHPLYAEVVAATGGFREERGPSGLLRKYPHAVGFIGPNGIKRIDRLGGQPGQAGQSAVNSSGSLTPALPLVRIEQPRSWIVVVPDVSGGRLSSHDRDIFGLARQLASQQPDCAVVALVLGELRENLQVADNALALAGADRLLHFADDAFNGYCPERELATLLCVERQLQPLHWLFPDTHLSGNDRALRLAARLGERPAMHAWQVKDGQVVCRGGSERIDIHRPLSVVSSRILALASECAMPVDDSRHEVLPMALPDVPHVLARIEDAGAVAVDPGQIALGEAEFILSAGNGIHDWQQFHKAAQVLGATEGGSRVAVDNGFLPRFRQVGATGTWVTARVYVAVGISGAVQHMQGIGQCEKVIAINTDPGCDMVKRADLSVIADSQEMLAALLHEVQTRTSSPKSDAASGGRHHVA
jgi:electron transfer flavoprotein alpha subunit